VGYTVVNGEVIVRAPAAYHASGTDVLRAGDVIVVVEREEIRDTETLRAVLAGVRRATVSVALERDGRRRYVTVDREALLADGW
jgi:S1-C subfamily serine protease